MFPGIHPAAAPMVPPLGMGLAFNPGLHHQPHTRLNNPSAAFIGGYYPQASYNGVQISVNKGGGAPVGAQTGASAGSNPSAPVSGYGLVNPQNPSAMAGMPMGSAANVAAAASTGHQGQVAMETTHMYIPNSAVGAVIGAKGSYIRDLNKYSGFSIKIASNNDETNSYPAAVNANDRRVTIVGPSDRFWAVSLFWFISGTWFYLEYLVPNEYLKFFKCNFTFFSKGNDIQQSVIFIEFLRFFRA